MNGQEGSFQGTTLTLQPNLKEVKIERQQSFAKAFSTVLQVFWRNKKK